MVSDLYITEAIESLLRQTNPSSTTFTSFNSVVHHLESKLGLDLTPKLDFIQSHIHLHLLRSHPPPPPLHHHQPPPKTHFLLHQNPNFHQPPPFAADDLGFRPPPPTKTESSAPATTDAAATESPKESSQTGKKRRGGPGGLNKLCGVSPELQAIVGHPALPRTEIVKQLWFYIRKNNLQDPSNKRKLICNDELRLVFETDCTDMFKMNKLLAKHIITLEPTKPVGRNSKKPKVEVESEAKNAESEPASGRDMIQSEVLRHVWEYIKVNQLEVGQGTYSSVFHARNLETGRIVALKKVRFDNFEPESVRFMAREIMILHRLDHPNIIKLEGLITSRLSCSIKLEGLITSRLSCSIYLVFEYMEHDISGLLSSPDIKLNAT